MSRLSLIQLTIIILSVAPSALLAEGPDSIDLRLDQGIDWGYGCNSAIASDPVRSPPAPMIPPGTAEFIYLEADNLHLDRERDELRLSGNGALRKNATYLEAGQIIYHEQPNSADLHQTIYLERPGLRLTADEGHLELDQDRGWLSNVEFRLPEHLLRGDSERAEMLSETESRYLDASFTTCPPGQRDWSISASEMEIDKKTGWGDAYHAVLKLGPVPVFYSPYLTFPVDDRRKSGLLLPSWGSSKDLGTEFSIPLYLNLAPQYDATLTPRWMSRRGMMWGGEFRFLGEHQQGSLSGEYLDDKVESTEHDNLRSAFTIKHNSNPFDGLTTRIDYKEVSDREYLNDFSTGLEFSSTRYLDRIGEIRYHAGNWNLSAQAQDFQTVDKSLAVTAYPYSLLPRLNASYHKLFESLNADLLLDSEFTSFRHDSKITGRRLRLMPSLGLEWSRPWAHLAPRLSLHQVEYHLDTTDPEAEDSPSFMVPILSLDSGLVFERDSGWFGTAATQTLEPRLFYLYAPMEDQSDIQDFDTADLELSFANLFKENRFSGGDRVGDANQLAFGLTSRWLETDTGMERLRASIGQIFYFWDREVQLTGETEEASESAVVAELSTRLGANWRSSLNLRWDPQNEERKIDKGRIGIHYQNPDQQLFNISYNYSDQDNIKTKIEDIDLSFYWEFDHRYTLLGDWLHSLVHKRDLNLVLGLGYSGRCCWSLTAVYQRYVKETDLDNNIDQEADTRYMLQLELRGLGFLGRDIRQTLKESIYGYRPEP